MARRLKSRPPATTCVTQRTASAACTPAAATLPPPPAHLVSQPRARPAVAQDRRPVPHPRLRDHAAADAGRSRAAEVPRVARQVSVASRCWPRRRPTEVARTWYPLGYNIRPQRLQSIARKRWRNYGGQLPSDDDDAAVVQGHRRSTPPARSAASPSGERAAILDTNVARVLFRDLHRQGRPQEPRDEEAAVGAVEALCCRTSTCSTSTRR